MSESESARAAGEQPPAIDDAGSGTADGGRPAARTIVAALAVAWFAATLWAAYRTLAGAPRNTSIGLAQAAIALPTAVTASLFAGLGAGLVSLALLASRWPGRPGGPFRRPDRFAGWERRALIGAAGGLMIGLLGVAAVVAAYGTGPFLAPLAGTIGVAALIGGELCAIRPAATVTAGLAGALATLAVGVIRGSFSGQLSELFGAGNTAASQLSADATLQLTISVISGVAAGLVAFWVLRRSGVVLRWPAYLLAGGAAGILLLVAEAVVRLGGVGLLGAAKATSPADRAVLDYLGSQRLNHALVVFFVGALVALVAVGRTMPARNAQTS